MLSEDGIGPDPDKVDALQNLRAATNQTQLRSFLWMTNYSSQSIQNYSTLSEPLRKLTRKKTRWVWTDKHQKCFETLKEALKSNALLNYYDPSLPTEVVCDGSPVGVGAILAQHKPANQE